MRRAPVCDNGTPQHITRADGGCGGALHDALSRPQGPGLPVLCQTLSDCSCQERVGFRLFKGTSSYSAQRREVVVLLGQIPSIQAHEVLEMGLAFRLMALEVSEEIQQIAGVHACQWKALGGQVQIRHEASNLAMIRDGNDGPTEERRLFEWGDYSGFRSTQFERDPTTGASQLVEMTVGQTVDNVACAIANGVDHPALAYDERQRTVREAPLVLCGKP